MKAHDQSEKNSLYAGIIWIISGISLLTYGIMSFNNSNIPGIEEILALLANTQGKHIYIVAFISVFLEGLYLVGNFFPGASLVLLLAIISQANGPATFVTTMLTIFFGWCLAGTLNIYGAKIYQSKISKLPHDEKLKVRDQIWTTWFPSFRASYEVAQVVEGADTTKVFLSSLRVRFFATLFVGAIALAIPLFYDINHVSDRESIVVLLIIAVISFVVGAVKIRKYFFQ
jgi:hypothetical protein